MIKDCYTLIFLANVVRRCVEVSFFTVRRGLDMRVEVGSTSWSHI